MAVERRKKAVTSASYRHGVCFVCVVAVYQTYTAVFEAAVDGAAASKPAAGTQQLMMRPFTFDLVGEGHLPTVRVSAPTLRNRSGLPLLLFRRLLIGRTQTLPLVLTNEGALQSQVRLHTQFSSEARSNAAAVT